MDFTPGNPDKSSLSTLLDEPTALREELLGWPASTHAPLAHELAECLDPAPDERAEQAWLNLAEQRMAGLTSSAVQPVPGADVLARARNRNH